MASSKERLNKANDWKGVLLEPMDLVCHTPFNNAEKEQFEHLSKRIQALFEHFNIDPSKDRAYLRLVISMAVKMGIPGFRLRSPYSSGKKIGAPAYQRPSDMKLYTDVVIKAKEHRCSERKAALEHIGNASTTRYRRFKETKKMLGPQGCAHIDVILECDDPEFQPIKELMLHSKDLNGTPALFCPDIRKCFVNLVKKEI